MPNYPYSIQLPPVNEQDIPSDGVAGQFLGINGGGQLDWLPVSAGSGDMLKADNLSGLTSYPTARTNLGLGTGDSPTFANLTLTSPSLSSSAPVTISQTWNNAAVAFTGLKVNAVSTFSADASLLLDLQLGGVTQVNSTKAGSLFARIFVSGNSQTSRAVEMAASGVAMGGLGILAFAPNSSYGSSSDLFNVADTKLARDGVGTLALRNGAAAQTFNVYGTSSSNNTVYERMFMRYTAASTLAFQIGTEQVGATVRPLEFLTAGVKRLSLSAAGSPVATLFSPSNTVSNLLVLRNLSDIAKFQFYLNGSGNSELYIGASNVLISETGSSYFNGGNVGIGTTAPGAKLEVWGNSASTISKVTSVSPGTASVLWLDGPAGQVVTSTGNLFLTSQSGNPIIFEVASTEKMRLLSNGNLGIGTTSPTSKLHVALNPATNYTTETVKFGNIHFGNGTGDYSNIWIGSIASPLTLTSENFTLASNGAQTILHATELYFRANGVNRWTLLSDGHLRAATDNQYDIGASGANRPRNVYVGTSVNAAGIIIANNQVYRDSSSVIAFPSNGVIRLSNYLATDFSLLQLGGGTNLFPAIKRSSTTLQARLADDSAFAPIQGKLTTDTAYTATVVAATGYITIYDSTGTAYRVPCAV